MDDSLQAFYSSPKYLEGFPVSMMFTLACGISLNQHAIEVSLEVRLHIQFPDEWRQKAVS